MKLLLLIVKNLRRNRLRTALTCAALFMLVFIVTVILSFLDLFDRFTAQKAGEQKGIVTERWQFPSQMPWSYANALRAELEHLPEKNRPTGYMTWQFYGGTLDPTKRTPENSLFMFALDPQTLPMMDEMESLDSALIKKLGEDRQGLLIGRDKLATLNKRVGDTIKVTSFTYKGIDLEFHILGLLPDGRYAQSAAMNRQYLLDALDAYKSTNRGVPHPLTDKTLNLFWFQARDLKSIELASARLETPGKFTQPAVKSETASSGIASFLEPFRDILWFLRWVLTPALLGIMALVIANAISISVRERRTEMAVMKVLGFRPGQVLMLILGESLLVGVLTGLFCSGLAYVLVTLVMHGIKFPIVFFPAFQIPAAALWWGPLIGGGTAFVGSFLPALGARSIKVSEVFSKVG
ncbi:MAG: ABC transporter permease [Gemmataceae bacterium]|nr:ABC transporter permease [Gemmataceae bacterium]